MILKILIAPDSFKGSLSAIEVCNSIEIGIRSLKRNIDTIKIPMADGGEGTLEALVGSTNGNIYEKQVKDPLFREIRSQYGILGDGKTAIIQMAKASGLPLLTEEERNPMNTTTYGTGELILEALNQGCRNFIIGIGGSMGEGVDILYNKGFTSIFSILDRPMNLEESMDRTPELIQKLIENIIRLI